MKRNSRNQHWFAAAASPLALALALVLGIAALTTAPAAAQEERLPSVSEYRLPDPSASPPGRASSRPQGPIDRDNPVILRPGGEPVGETPSAADETPAPSPSASASAGSAPARPVAAPAARPSGTSAASTAYRPAAAPAATASAAIRTPDASSPASAALPDAVGEASQPAAAPGAAIPPIAWNVHSAREEGVTVVWPWLAGIAVLLASNALLLFMLVRRRQARAAAANETAEYETAPVAEPIRPVAAAEQSEPEAASTAPDIEDPELDLLTVLAQALPPESAPAVPASPEPAARPSLDIFVNPLEVTLAARRLSATLMNTVLNYELVIANNSDAPIGPVSVAGDMIGAHASLPTRSQLEMGGNAIAPQHRIDSLGPGDSVTVTGEFRLPLAAITPIRSGNASLFVPLARFRVEALRKGAPPLAVNRTFVIGESQDQPGAALKPFRLDLGPRLYSHIGQREVAATA